MMSQREMTSPTSLRILLDSLLLRHSPTAEVSSRSKSAASNRTTERISVSTNMAQERSVVVRARKGLSFGSHVLTVQALGVDVIRQEPHTTRTTSHRLQNQ